MSEDPRDHSSYAEIGSGADIPTSTGQSASTSPEIGPTPVPSRPQSPEIVLQEPPKQRERGRVRFHNDDEISATANRRSPTPLGGEVKSPSIEAFPRHTTQTFSRSSSVASLLRNTFDGTNDMGYGSPERSADSSRGASPSSIRKPRPSVLRNNSFGSVYRPENQVRSIGEEEITSEKLSSAIRAQERYVDVTRCFGADN